MKTVTVQKIQRDPKELGAEGENLPAHNFPNFIVDFQYGGVPHKVEMALELGGRDAEYNFPTTIDPDEIADISEVLMNEIYGSKPYEDAVKAVEATF